MGRATRQRLPWPTRQMRPNENTSVHFGALKAGAPFDDDAFRKALDFERLMIPDTVNILLIHDTYGSSFFPT